MGTKITKYSFKPKENEQIDTVIRLQDEPRSVIHGVVIDEKGNLVKDAVVKLLKKKDCDDGCYLIPITHVFTDECGQFLFGPLLPELEYVIKVWVNDVKIHRTEVESPVEESEDPEQDPPVKAVQPQKQKSASKDYIERYYYKF